MKYLPDTNIFIRAIQNHEPEATFLKRVMQKQEFGISAVVIAEFYGKGELPVEEEVAFGKLVKIFPVLLIDAEVAELAGRYRSQFLVKTKRVFIIDCIIAAQAKLHNLTIVTNNKADFPMSGVKVICP